MHTVRSSGVQARRLLGNGVPVDATPITVLASAAGGSDVEALVGDFLVVGLQCAQHCEIVYPIAARVRGTDGAVLDTVPIALNGIFCSSPRVTMLGGRWLVAYQNNASHDNSSAVTDAAFIDANGVKTPEFVVHGYYSTAGGNGDSTYSNIASATTP